MNAQNKPYVIVDFQVIDNQTFTTIVKSFWSKKAAENWGIEKNAPATCQVMTRKKYEKEASLCM